MVIICEVFEKMGAAGRGRAEDSMEERAPLGTCLMLRLVAWKGSKENELHTFAVGLRLLCILMRRALWGISHNYLRSKIHKSLNNSVYFLIFGNIFMFRVLTIYAMFILFFINVTPNYYNGICIQYREWLKNNNCINRYGYQMKAND